MGIKCNLLSSILLKSRVASCIYIKGETLLSVKVETVVKPLTTTVKTLNIVNSAGISSTVEGISYIVSLLR